MKPLKTTVEWLLSVPPSEALGLFRASFEEIGGSIDQETESTLRARTPLSLRRNVNAAVWEIAVEPNNVGTKAVVSIEKGSRHKGQLNHLAEKVGPTVVSRADPPGLWAQAKAAGEEPPRTTERPGWNARQGRTVGGPEILSGRVRKALERNLQRGEEVRFCLKGDFDHSLIALRDRLLIIKAGVFAGTTFGARVATIYYKDVTGIEVNTGLLNCVVEVSTPSYPAVGKKSMWFGGRTSKTDPFNRDPYTESNTIPVMRHRLKQWTPHLEELRELIAAAKDASVALPANPTAGLLTAQLKELTELHKEGALSDEEFAQAKAQLLSGR